MTVGVASHVDAATDMAQVLNICKTTPARKFQFLSLPRMSVIISA
eukprot:CAMPEP_0115377198 /NCGR_PEP_ID=MMETSP0271-20121206/3365_1 /TAXON_ID=71861 /ORGANISM="Scrippsiella trochoidea, Strain CCMP3099" /LENGTH=44 /DNA_ID= /DNA_START= /DNA_END= /DNA_ORIENTATION=